MKKICQCHIFTEETDLKNMKVNKHTEKKKWKSMTKHSTYEVKIIQIQHMKLRYFKSKI